MPDGRGGGGEESVGQPTIPQQEKRVGSKDRTKATVGKMKRRTEKKGPPDDPKAVHGGAIMREFARATNCGKSLVGRNTHMMMMC